MNNQIASSLKEILPLVRKPSQYIGEEINSIKKDLTRVRATIGLVFPDLYEIGMSHIGLKILYHIVNKREEFAAERFFAPDIDFEELLRKKCTPLRSLENNIPLNQFDLVGFTFQYEMSYSNILNILDLGHIPILREDRGREHPLIIGGGPCAYNPEPLADFFDCIIVGDGEEVILEILNIYSISKNNNEERNHLLQRLAKIKGVYVPSMFNIEYFEDGKIKKVYSENDKHAKVKRRFLLDLNKADYPVAPVVPFTKIVHDRVPIEIDRGCTQGCRFCQAGYIYRPVRERTVENILELSKRAVDNTGYSDISLLSLNSGDYSKINILLPALAARCISSNVSLSLPSLRPKTVKTSLIDCIGLTGKPGFTLAIEAGSQRLRNVLNKKITEDEIFTAVENIAQAGWEIIKLYFMIGLPTETYADLEEIYLICKKIYSVAKKRNRRFKKLNISISFFVPKAHTPFQWVPMENITEMQTKFNFLKSKFKSRSKYKIKWQNPELSFLEAVFARGDRRLGKVLLNAFQLGCKFDAWSEHFNLKNWIQAFEKAQIDPAFYVQRNFDQNEIFPWDFVDIGVKKDYLLEEYLASKREVVQKSCREEKCLKCGLEVVCSSLKKIERKELPENFQSIDLKKMKNDRENSKIIFRYRVQFTKFDLKRFLSHFEISALLIRALKRAKLPVCYTMGFHPRPKISFDFALPVGMESKSEFFDVHLPIEFKPDYIMNKLNQEVPQGIKICSVTKIPLNSKSLPLITTRIQFKIYIERIEGEGIQPLNFALYEQRLVDFLSQDKINLDPKNGGAKEEISFSKWFDVVRIKSKSEKCLILELVAKVKHGKLIPPHKVLNTLYPELDVNKGNYRMVKEAAYFAV